MKSFRVYILFVLLLGHERLMAEERAVEVSSLSLSQAISFALEKRPELLEATAMIDASKGRAVQAGKFPNPELITRLESVPLRNESGERDAELLAGFSQSFPIGGRLGKARTAEEFEKERRVKILEVKRREVEKTVHSAFATALYQERAFQTQKSIEKSLDKAVSTTRARLKEGDALKEDVARVEMELARTKVEVGRAESLRSQALTLLSFAIGGPGIKIHSLSGELDAALEIPTLEELSESLSSQPGALAVDADIKAQGARLDAAKAARVPDIKVELLYHRFEEDPHNTIDVGLSIPFPLFDRNQGRIKEAQADLNAARARARIFQNTSEAEMREAHGRLLTALAASRALKTEVLPRADTVLKAVELRYAEGDISLTEALPVRRDWAAVQLSYLESLRAVMEAWAALTPFLKGKERAQ